MRHERLDKLSSGILIILIVIFWMIVSPLKAQQNLRIIFLHHSCGSNLIEQGMVREGLTVLGYQFFDHGYNDEGICRADGQCPGTNYDVPGDNTDPDGIAEIFTQSLLVETDNTFSYLMQYDVIMFKSCYPTSNISNDVHLEEYQANYLAIRDRMDQYPDKVFVIVTQPPQVPGSSNRAEAHRARQLAEWLSSDAFLDGHPNVFTFDFFGYLAADDNFLRAEYRVDNHDAHPNDRANREIGPRFVSFIDTAIRNYQDIQNPPVVSPTNPGVGATPVDPLAAEDGNGETPSDGSPDESPVDTELEEEKDSGGMGSLPCPGTFVPLLLLSVVVVVNHDIRYNHRQGENQ